MTAAVGTVTSIAGEPLATSGAQPEIKARVSLIDALRGAALFGVLLINMLWFAGQQHAVSAEQFGAMPGARLDETVENLIDLFVAAKAIGIFSFLFGVGFAMQIPKLGARYPRRLIALLAIGLVHWLAVWSGEILHVYAIAGFLLLLVYRVRAALLVPIGLGLAVFARPIVGRLYLLFDPGLPGGDAPGPTLMAHRLDVLSHGSFIDIVAMQLHQDIRWQLLTGATLAAIVHALGRFMVGVAVARSGCLSDPAKYRRAFLLLAFSVLPVGLLFEHDWLFTGWMTAHGWLSRPLSIQIVGHTINSVGVLCMTAGYVAVFALSWSWRPLNRLLMLFAPAGRMALTNYLLQTVVNYLLFCSFGLDLIGEVGVAGCLALTLAVFVAQLIVSRWWLEAFDFGPFEWLWRWWTYGARPPLRKRARA